MGVKILFGLYFITNFILFPIFYIILKIQIIKYCKEIINYDIIIYKIFQGA